MMYVQVNSYTRQGGRLFEGDAMSENDLTPTERQLAKERLHAMDMQDKATNALSLVGELQRNIAQLNMWIAEIVGGKENGNPETEG